MSEKMRVETIEEFLARGGIIKKYPAVPMETDHTVRPTTPQGTSELMSLDEGAHYFSEMKVKRVRKNKDPLKGVDVEKLPDSIRKLLNI
jgi:hypothetical protein